MLMLIFLVDSLIKTVDNMVMHNMFAASEALPFGIEASWMTGNWEMLERLSCQPRLSWSSDFDVGIGKALMAISHGDKTLFLSTMRDLRGAVTRGLSHSNTASLSRAHSQLFKLHALHEIRALSGFDARTTDCKALTQTLRGRLEIMGSFIEDQEYILCLRRAVMELSR
jgi:serine/threonine-protein kinase ATR